MTYWTQNWKLSDLLDILKFRDLLKYKDLLDTF